MKRKPLVLLKNDGKAYKLKENKLSYRITALNKDGETIGGLFNGKDEGYVTITKRGKYVLGVEPDYSNGILTEKELHKHIRIQHELDKIYKDKPIKWYQFWRRG